MKFHSKIAALLVATVLFASCSGDDSNTISEGATGDVELYFDNGVNGDALVLGSSYTNSNNETLTINRLNYIISNIELMKEDGSSYVYPKESGYFIISQAAGLFTIHLDTLPAGDYTRIKFGIGVDSQRYLQGETAQQSFWDLATEHNLTWTWSTGYRFINFEGTFTSPNDDIERIFQVHQGSNSATDNYREVVLSLPVAARVRKDEMPSIHVKADAGLILDGQTKVRLGDNLNGAGTAASIMGGENLIHIADNTLEMFTVDHVHNGSGNHHGE